MPQEMGVITGILAAAVLCGLAIWALLAGRRKKDKNNGTDTPPRHGPEHKPEESAQNQAAALWVQASQAEAKAVYSKVFASMGLPLQKLLALSQSQAETDRYQNILEGEILQPLKNTVNRFQLSFTGSSISLPPAQPLPKQTSAPRFEHLPARDLEAAVRDCQDRIRQGQIYEIPQAALDRMSPCLQSLITAPAGTLSLKRIQDLADEAGTALTQSGIYPMFRQDERLAERPDLRSLFTEVHGGEPVLPGFFIEVHGRLQLYGNFQGTCLEQRPETVRTSVPPRKGKEQDHGDFAKSEKKENR